MAKLSANGTELFRAMKRVDAPKNHPHLEWNAVHYSFRSNGRVLRKQQVRYRGNQYPGDTPRNHDWGWKRYKTFSLDRLDFIKENMRKSGYTIVERKK